MPVSEEIRQAITARIEERCKDAEFRARLRRSIEENQKILDRLVQQLAWHELDLVDFLLIAEAVLEIPAEDAARVGRLELAESALHAPRAEFGGVEFSPDLARKTAVLGSRLIGNRPLPDGNKRVGELCAVEFVVHKRRDVDPAARRPGG